MINYIPNKLYNPTGIDKFSAWSTVAPVIWDIIERFGIITETALELGVGNGYSYSILKNYFKRVIGVDINLKDAEDIDGYEMSFEEYITKYDDVFDLIHIDLSHTYKQTVRAGEWAINHSGLVLFHDTKMEEVRKAVEYISTSFNLYFYNYDDPCGLGILSNKSIQ